DPGGALEALTDGDEIFVTQPAVVIETLISKYLFNSDKGDEK
ncbi:MAG: outer membrane lipid asymmetry maintenance protein MlaD, partial [Xanthomonadales bacterium]|nr:outer membrane lipid asymmetry maintenance protein MlaD [Xanthomonadales bacterium]